MKHKEFGAVAAAALVVASLALSASAAEAPDVEGIVKGASLVAVAVDVDLSQLDRTNIPEGELIALGEIDPDTVTVAYTVSEDEAGTASVRPVDVDLSDIDWTALEAGEPIALGPVVGAEDGVAVTWGFTDSPEAAARLEEAGVDLTDLDSVAIWSGTLEELGKIDPADIPGGFATKTAGK